MSEIRVIDDNIEHFIEVLIKRMDKEFQNLCNIYNVRIKLFGGSHFSVFNMSGKEIFVGKIFDDMMFNQLENVFERIIIEPNDFIYNKEYMPS